MRPGDRLLICSDGFYETVPDEEIGRICSATQSSIEACAALLRVAMERDGSDNITVAVLCVSGVQAEPIEESRVGTDDAEKTGERT